MAQAQRSNRRSRPRNTQQRTGTTNVPSDQRRRTQSPQPRHARSASPQRRRGLGTGAIIAIVLLLIALVVGIVLFLTQCRGTHEEAQPTNATQTQVQYQNATVETEQNQTTGQNATTSSAIDKDSWELTLVNKTHPLPDDWSIELAEVDDGKYVDARIAEQFTQMIADCRAAGYDDVFVNQAYRSHEEQQAIWDEFYNQYLEQGYSEEEAESLTGESVAIPGTSEHELGLAADICSINFDEEYNAPIQTWLRENGHKYGFIQRYPAGKEDITGTKNENWHFRYVGVEAATQIYESGQVLEEYLGE